MKIVYFTHSLISCWNHGNAHFLRGVLRALLGLGHDVTLCEPFESWSRNNLIADAGTASISQFCRDFPELAPRIRFLPEGDDAKLEQILDGAGLVLVHEWTAPALAASIGARRARGAKFTLLFHDTHHRMVSEPAAMARYDLSGYDGVLAFGEALSAAYRAQGFSRVFTWHEAADTALFRPPQREAKRRGAVWIGNWGDGERADELRDYMLTPARSLNLDLDVFGVRYPEAARAELARAGARFHGWAANARVPEIFARHAFTLHIPRQFYVTHLPGIPTIRVFEALACGIPLLCAPWPDAEHLFNPGQDYLQARNPREMFALMRDLAEDSQLRETLAARGLATLRARHTCLHRARELLAIVARLRGQKPVREAA